MPGKASASPVIASALARQSRVSGFKDELDDGQRTIEPGSKRKEFGWFKIMNLMGFVL